ncbi:head-tail connector [Shewanella sp. phage 1/44]|uniref:head-tail adaptor Ad1 n=1 Tax=Shewanella sp. phage 1/44 TaxID=1458862 RepID=UPI0004F8AF58|nr:head-tail adaptor Ad1 [Shewanella sp. phage 1/44]AHK11736.1 head-tail connector [Shewanella sp. phage 1/44]
MTFTLEQLAALKAAYASGVLKVRNGDDWLEYNSMREMRLAISDITAEIAAANAGGKPSGTRLVSVSRGYTR